MALRFTGSKSFRALRLLLAVVFGFIGAFIAWLVFHPLSSFLIILAVFAFGILGYILPELLQFAAKAGVAALASAIINHLPQPPDLNPVHRLPFRKKRNSSYVNPLVLDTSTLVDGRIIDIVETGFVFGTFLVVPSVIGELHKLADSADELKRARGRKGLENLEVLGKSKKAKLEVLKSEPNDHEVDDKLVSLARKVKGKVVTVDFNLNKVAKVHKVSVLNVNELANAVKTAVLPNETIKIKVNSVGSGKDQGVGYLLDGTMVVVEGGAGLRGRTVEVRVLRVLQTAAGKMIFARPLGT